MILIKKASKKEKYGNSEKQKTMLKLSEIYKTEIVFMPYGEKGCGFYLNKERTKKNENYYFKKLL